MSSDARKNETSSAKPSKSLTIAYLPRGDISGGGYVRLPRSEYGHVHGTEPCGSWIWTTLHGLQTMMRGPSRGTDADGSCYVDMMVQLNSARPAEMINAL
jgi:hypothetical protein